jgi:hypothetical protein
MKLIKNTLIVLGVSALFLAACDKKKETKTRALEAATLEKNSSQKPKNTISYEEAKGLQQEYIKTRANSLNKILNNEKKIQGQDARDVSFDLESLKQYITYVEAEAGKKGLKGLGLRVYYGAYKKTNETVKNSGYSTVFFMPTYQPKSETSAVNRDINSSADEVIDGVDGLNRGTNGYPPNDLK